MEKFIIEGGHPLRGTIEIRGAKNAATPILVASLLTDKPCTIDNLPLIKDVFKMLEILESLGVKIDWLGKRKIKIQAKNIDPSKMKYDLIYQLRSSILLIGPLMARSGKVKIPHPGGCFIGSRPIDVHLEALAKLGAKIKQDKDFYYLTAGKKPLKNREVVLKEFSVTATENLMMACALNPDEIIVKIAASEPHVQDLANFLSKMGVEIEGAGTHTLKIKGKKELSGATHTLIPDPIEAGTFIIAGAATRGKVTVKNIISSHLDLVLEKLKEMNISFTVKKNSSGLENICLNPSAVIKSAKIEARIYPGIPTDLQPLFAVLATQAQGTSLIHDTLFEGRLKYIEELLKMGANAVLCDPHRALITGPTPLYGQEITSFDLRAGATLIIASLVAKGKSVINKVEQIDRGYEEIEKRLQKLGANIRRSKQ